MIIWGDLIFNNMLSEINDNAILAKYSNENMKKKVKSAILISGESINVTIYDNLNILQGGLKVTDTFKCSIAPVIHKLHSPNFSSR